MRMAVPPPKAPSPLVGAITSFSGLAYRPVVIFNCIQEQLYNACFATMLHNFRQKVAKLSQPNGGSNITGFDREYSVSGVLHADNVTGNRRVRTFAFNKRAQPFQNSMHLLRHAGP